MLQHLLNQSFDPYLSALQRPRSAGLLGGVDSPIPGVHDAVNSPAIFGTGHYLTGTDASGNSARGEVMSPGGGGLLSGLLGGGGEPNYGLMALGQGISQGDVAGSFANFATPLALQRQKSKTREWLIGQGMDPNQADVISSDPALLREMFKPGAKYDHLMSVGGHIYDKSSGQWISPPGNDKDVRKEYGRDVQWAIGPDGKWAPFLATSEGKMERAIGEEGYDFAPPGSKTIDTGTSTIVTDRSGNELSAYEKDLAGVETEKAKGQATVDFKRMKSNLPGLKTVVGELKDLADKATYTLGGQAFNWGRTQIGMAPTEGQVARTEYVAKVANQVLPLLRETFGAQFTAAEGDKLLATMGDPDKTPKEKQAVLDALIEQKIRDVQALAVQAGEEPTVPAPSGAPDSGGWVDKGNGVRIRRKN